MHLGDVNAATRNSSQSENSPNWNKDRPKRRCSEAARSKVGRESAAQIVKEFECGQTIVEQQRNFGREAQTKPDCDQTSEKFSLTRIKYPSKQNQIAHFRSHLRKGEWSALLLASNFRERDLQKCLEIFPIRLCTSPRTILARIAVTTNT